MTGQISSFARNVFYSNAYSIRASTRRPRRCASPVLRQIAVDAYVCQVRRASINFLPFGIQSLKERVVRAAPPPPLARVKKLAPLIDGKGALRPP